MFLVDMLAPASRKAAAGAAAMFVLFLAVACGGGGDVILATTTSTFDSGLLDVLVPAFEEESEFNVKVIPVGTGQALEMGRRGDADLLLVHAPAAELEFIENGYGRERTLVMHNDFVIVGPAGDPAAVRDATDALDALARIAAAEGAFISRGDDSGTHKRELALWQELGIDPVGMSWYREAGQGMAATLQVANQRDSYTISDRATFLALRDNLDVEVLHEGDPRLLNIYHVMLVEPGRYDNLNVEGARAFAAFLVADEGQALIEEFGIDRFGQPLFIPDAGKSEDELGQP